jgi:SAM-dependent methyltransferase
MKPKPKHLGLEYASQFRDPRVVEAYRFRPPYPPETFPLLLGLLPESPRTILDAGCGPGPLARFLTEGADRVDAVDFSAEMIRNGERLPGGNHPGLRWIVGAVEDAPLAPPYGLVTAGQSLHWMEWDRVLPRLERALAPDGFLAIVELRIDPPPWEEELRKIIPKYSTNRDFEPTDLLAELTSRRLFRPVDERVTAPVSFTQTVQAYVESFHSMNGFSRDRMTREAADAFDESVRRIAAPFCPEGTMTVAVKTMVRWGRPGSPG